MTRDQLIKKIYEAAAVYVIVEIAKDTHVRVAVDPSELSEVVEAEGSTLGDDLIVREEHFEEDEETYPGFDLVVGNIPN